MRSFWQAVAGAFFGKLLAALFIVICMALGFGPGKWAAVVIGASQTEWIWAARAGFITLAIAVFIVMFIVPAVARSALLFTWQYRPEERDWAPLRRVISLRDAAQLSYEKLRGRTLSAQKLPIKFADMKFEGQSNPVSWLGVAILGRGEIPVFGRHPPSTKLELVPEILVRASGTLSDDADSIHLYGEETPEYESLVIKCRDFSRRLKVVKGWHVENI